MVCESLGADGTWGKNGLILFDAAVRGIAGVASTGGVLKQYTVFDSTRGDVDHSWPWFLPDGDHFLFHVLDSTRWQDFTRGELELQVRIGSINSSVTESLLTANSRVEYCDPGFLIYVNRHHLVAHPFDADNLKFAGESVPVVSVHSIASAYGLEFSVSNNGTLAYMASGPSAPLRLGYLVRVDRDGNVLDTIGGKALYGDATYSPDNSMVAYCSFPELRQSYDITIYNTEHKTMTSITNDQRIDYVPVWSPDGSTIAYGSQRERLFPHNVTLQSISDASANRVLDFPDSLAIIPLQWTKDDRILLEEGVLQVAATVPRVWSCPVDHQDSARLLLGGPLKEVAYGLSPDNRYLLTVLQTGTTREVFLVDLQGNKARRRVSTGEGDYPRWRSDGREIYYLEGDVLLAVPVSYSPELQLGEPEKLFRLEVPPHWKDETTNFSYFGYDATRDGKEFVVVKSASKVDQPAECEVIVNWPSEIGVGQ